MFDAITKKDIITFDEFNEKYNKKGDLKVNYYMIVFDKSYFLTQYKASIKRYQDVYEEKIYKKLINTKESEIKLFFVPVFKVYTESKTFDYTYTEKGENGEVPRSTRKKFDVKTEAIDDPFDIQPKKISYFPMGNYYKTNGNILDCYDIDKATAEAVRKAIKLQDDCAAELDKTSATVTERHLNNSYEIILIPFYMIETKDNKKHYMNALTGDYTEIGINDELLKQNVLDERNLYIQNAKTSLNVYYAEKKKKFRIVYIINTLCIVLGLIAYSMIVVFKPASILATILMYSLMGLALFLMLTNFIPEPINKVSEKILKTVESGVDYLKKSQAEVLNDARIEFKKLFIKAIISMIGLILCTIGSLIVLLLL